MQYCAAHKTRIAADAQVRDGPAFNSKQCLTCSAFANSSATICPACNVPMTKEGTATLNSNSTGATTAAAHGRGGGISKGQATAALETALLNIDTNRNYVVAKIHDQRGEVPNVEYHIQWANCPNKADWEWTRAAHLVSEGKCTCPRAFPEFHASRKGRKA